MLQQIYWWFVSLFMSDFWEFPALLLGARRCPVCGRFRRSVRRSRRSTAYCDDRLNFIVCCDDCYEREEDYWADMWSDYYSGCM